MRLLVKFLFWLARSLSGGSGAKGKSDSSTQIEVERKYRISSEEFASLPGLLKREGFRFYRKQDMTDTFIPAKVESDMIRIRDLTSDGCDSSVLTLKKWIDVEGERVRQERETESLDPVVRDCLLEMGSRLADDALLTISKKRDEFQAERNGKTVTVALDQVEGLGAYSGSYMEVEVLAKHKDDVKQALVCVEEFAELLLGEVRETAPSYKEMLRMSLEATSK